jgi:hypothetical protein
MTAKDNVQKIGLRACLRKPCLKMGIVSFEPLVYYWRIRVLREKAYTVTRKN